MLFNALDPLHLPPMALQATSTAGALRSRAIHLPSLVLNNNHNNHNNNNNSNNNSTNNTNNNNNNNPDHQPCRPTASKCTRPALTRNSNNNHNNHNNNNNHKKHNKHNNNNDNNTNNTNNNNSNSLTRIHIAHPISIILNRLRDHLSIHTTHNPQTTHTKSSSNPMHTSNRRILHLPPRSISHTVPPTRSISHTVLHSLNNSSIISSSHTIHRTRSSIHALRHTNSSIHSIHTLCSTHSSIHSIHTRHRTHSSIHSINSSHTIHQTHISSHLIRKCKTHLRLASHTITLITRQTRIHNRTPHTTRISSQHLTYNIRIISRIIINRLVERQLQEATGEWTPFPMICSENS
ncbi:unnamed protein product [Polarella glacialis]|uniref:Uncharacterized protein n=2 Tax=Polarella glacialis TaxID=89957 RepID=A0A813L5J2_POLGL|nr:unnamed protein product [Polarella glacialis]